MPARSHFFDSASVNGSDLTAISKTRGLYTGGVGLFSPKAQEVVIAKVKELAKAAGRPASP